MSDPLTQLFRVGQHVVIVFDSVDDYVGLFRRHQNELFFLQRLRDPVMCPSSDVCVRAADLLFGRSEESMAAVERMLENSHV